MGQVQLCERVNDTGMWHNDDTKAVFYTGPSSEVGAEERYA